MTLKPLATACLMAFLAAPAVASDVKILPMDRVDWSFEGDSFGCKLTLSAHEHGKIEIRHDAGKDLSLVYEPVIRPEGTVQVSWSDAPWQKMSKTRAFTASKDRDRFVAGAKAAFSVMDALNQGHWLSIRNGSSQVRIPSVRWSEPSKEFHLCRYEVSPLSIEQARDQSLFFDIGRRSVSEEHLEMISDTAKYITLDPKVKQVLVDSYTDNTGNRLANLQLSRERAADVAAALESAGVPPSMIETRGHGERYPSADNSSYQGRNKSRKVTIRIIRE